MVLPRHAEIPHTALGKTVPLVEGVELQARIRCQPDVRAVEARVLVLPRDTEAPNPVELDVGGQLDMGQRRVAAGQRVRRQLTVEVVACLDFDAGG